MTRCIISYNSANINMYLISENYKNYFTHHSPISQNILHFGDNKKTQPGHGTILPGVSNTGIPGRAAAGSGRTYDEVFLQARPRWVRQARQASKPRSNPNTTCFAPLFLRRVAKDCGVFFLKFIY